MSRAVMQQALDALEYCIREAGPCEHDCGVCVCMETKAANGLRAELAKPDGWIPVDDWTPENGVDVLVYRPMALETHDPLLTIDEFTNRVGHVSPQGVEHGFERWCHPTHWMPLPEAPEVGR